MKTDTKTLIDALRILAQDVQSDDGIANACIAEAADRLEELHNALDLLLYNTDPPPLEACDCHINPPCSDCTMYGGLREAIYQAKQALG